MNAKDEVSYQIATNEEQVAATITQATPQIIEHPGAQRQFKAA